MTTPIVNLHPVIVPARTAVLLLFMPPVRTDPQQQAILTDLANSLQEHLGAGLRVLRIDEAIHPEVVQSFRITQTPTFVLVRQGVEIWRQEGMPDSATLASIRQGLS
jgi:thioredoxin-like negative regulator of GroEL